MAPVLTALDLYGAAAGIGLAGLALALERGALRMALPLVLAAACLYSQFGVSAEISEIRTLAFGPNRLRGAVVLVDCGQTDLC